MHCTVKSAPGANQHTVKGHARTDPIKFKKHIQLTAVKTYYKFKKCTHSIINVSLLHKHTNRHTYTQTHANTVYTEIKVSRGSQLPYSNIFPYVRLGIIFMYNKLHIEHKTCNFGCKKCFTEYIITVQYNTEDFTDKRDYKYSLSSPQHYCSVCSVMKGGGAPQVYFNT